ncbi:winged helix-turn-helix domain-containing protein [Rhodococcus erythropolis]|uniref:winged helix-turn-helix domain-containing protein n=1 Tax=Rhodococcus erythropolis TaxID=1833 RepID=UPI0022272D49|nr:winged helix-turn-helix domain-containing protein [Rhodococcus erythropolis]MCW2295369.1 DNA-binding winged helix-turn-helix (wHTH) protein [Rhodococcus erythropolis]
MVDSVCGATNAPVLILGALSADRALMVLREGVDAIIPSGLSGEETLARIFAIVRRSSEALAPTTRYLESGTLRLDLWQSLLKVDHDVVHLTTIEIKLLAYLMRNAGSTLEPRRIVEHVWQDYASAGDNALRIAVGRLRSKLGDDAKAPRYIGVARGRGYKFLPPVVEILDEARSAATRNAQVEYLDSMASLAKNFGASVILTDLCSSLVDHFIDSGFADAAAVHSITEGRMLLISYRGLSDEWAATARNTAIDQRYASARAIQESSPVHLTQAGTGYPFTNAALEREGQGEYIFLPIEVQTEMRACVGVIRRNNRTFDNGSLAYLRASLAMFAAFLQNLEKTE